MSKFELQQIKDMIAERNVIARKQLKSQQALQ